MQCALGIQNAARLAIGLVMLVSLGCSTAIEIDRNSDSTEYCLFTDLETNKYFHERFPDNDPVIKYHTGERFQINEKGKYLSRAKYKMGKIAILGDDGTAQYIPAPVKNTIRVYLDENKEWIIAKVRGGDKDNNHLSRSYYVSRKFGKFERLSKERALDFDASYKYLARVFEEKGRTKYRIYTLSDFNIVLEGLVPLKGDGRPFSYVDIASDKDSLYVLFGDTEVEPNYRLITFNLATWNIQNESDIVPPPSSKKVWRRLLKIDVDKKILVFRTETETGWVFVKNSLDLFGMDGKYIRTLRIKSSGRASGYYLMRMQKSGCRKNYLIDYY